MAGGTPSPLLVSVSPRQNHIEKLKSKLLIYFQSPSRSGGGECDVQVFDRDQGVYAVQFQSEEVMPGNTILWWNPLRQEELGYISL